MDQLTTISAIIIGLFCVSLALLFYRGHFIKRVEQVAQDAWADGPEEPKAAYWFTFSSKGAFTTNYPIKVSIKLWITKGQETMLPLSFVFPDAFVYPRRISQGHPPEAPTIPVAFSQAERAYVGEGTIEFTAPGQFGYIIHSKGNPVFYAAQRKTITISPVEIRAQLSGNERNIGIALIGVGVAIIAIAVGLLTLPLH